MFAWYCQRWKESKDGAASPGRSPAVAAVPAPNGQRPWRWFQSPPPEPSALQYKNNVGFIRYTEKNLYEQNLTGP